MTGPAVIYIVGLGSGEPSEFDGEYVREYDASRSTRSPSGIPMFCHLRTTPKRAEALVLPFREAFELWRSVDRRQPLRPDGMPNRPLTGFTVEIVPAAGTGIEHRWADVRG